MIRFIHAADLHLDTPFSGLEQTSKTLAEKLREAPFESLAKIVDIAIERAVDFVLFSGDLYNTKRVNIKAQSLFIEHLNRLNKSDIPVYLIRGNHDYLTEEAQKLALPFPKNVYTYGPDVETHILETKNKERIAITGFSYDTQWVTERKIKEYPKRRSDINLQIGLLHGDIETSLTREANYAPFTLAELREKNYDYWALGHVHQRQRIAEQPSVYYPGNIQGLHKNETGEKGCLFIEWTPREQHVQFIPTAPVIWESMTLELSEIENVSDLIQAMQEAIAEKEYKQDVLINLIIKAKTDDDEDLIHFTQEKEFAEQLSKQLGVSNVWVASVELIVEEAADQQALQKMYPNEWDKVLRKAEKTTIFNELTERIFEQIPSRYLNQTNSKAYREQMIQKAIAKLHLK
jgi:DNA repair exonuclease SbcCD nuclease subunit